MRITIFTIGSRGDVQPYVALGMGLQRAGHAVTIATHAPFAGFVAQHGLGFRPVTGNPREVLESEQGQRWLRSRNAVTFLREFRRITRPLLEQGINDAWDTCHDAGAIIFSPLGMVTAHVAEKLGLPCAMAVLLPQGATRAFPSPLVAPGFPLGGTYNYLTHVSFDWLYWLVFRDVINDWRRNRLGLTPLPLTPPYRRMIRLQIPALYGYSPSVVPQPADWPDCWQTTGYWFLDAAPDWQPSESLAKFLASGPPPVYIGFGSMATQNAETLTGIAVEALRRTGHRGVLLSGWAGLGGASLPEQVCLVDDVPHGWLFPQMAAVVHHGGAGTTGAGLRAGVPSIVTPVFGDQPFWGSTVARLGVGTRPLPQRTLTVEALAGAIHTATTDAGMRARAAALGVRIRAEDGVARAVDILGAHLARKP